MVLMALVPAFALAAGAIAIPRLGAFSLVAIHGHETRGRDLRELEKSPSCRTSSRIQASAATATIVTVSFS